MKTDLFPASGHCWVFQGAGILSSALSQHHLFFWMLSFRLTFSLSSFTFIKKLFSSSSLSALLIIPKPLTVWITVNCGKFWKRWEYQTTWPASWEICMQVRKQQNWTWNNRLVPNRKGVRQGYILSPCLFNLYAEYIMRNAGLEEAQAGIKIAGRNK